MQNEIILLVILLGLSAFFSGSETALLSVSRLKVRHLINKKKKGAETLKKLKDDPQRMLITILIGNNVVNVAAAAIVTKLIIDLGYSNAVGIATGIMTFLLLVFGEITPKSLVTYNYEFIALLIAKRIWVLSIILYPFIFLLNMIVEFFNRIFNIKRKKPIVTEEELKSYVKAGEEAGAIKEMEKEMIQNIFKFDDVSVEEIMTPMPDIVSIDMRSKVKDVIRVVKRAPYSRFPVYEQTRDNIQGILNIKDVYNVLNRKGAMNLPIRNIIRKPFFVLEIKKIDSLLKQFQKRKEHMAIVVDEYGVVSGLVTIENVLEEIVGEIMDETDGIMPIVKKINKKTWQVLGKADIDEVNEKIGTEFKDDRVETIGGFILGKAGKMLHDNDEVDIDSKWKAVVEEVYNKRIIAVKLVKK